MKCKCKDCGSTLEMTEGAECLCPRCGYEHTASEVKERIASAKREESERRTPKRAPPRPASRRPASPYVDPFSSASGKVEKGSSAKAAVLYGAAVVLGVAIIAILAMRISRFASSHSRSSGPLVAEHDTKPVKTGVPKDALPVSNPVPSGQPAPSTTISLVQGPEPRGKPVARWTHPKDWYEGECANAERIMERLQSGGYKMSGGSASAKSVGRLIAELRRCVIQDNPHGAEAAHAKLVADLKEYSAHCVWTKGLRHPKYMHIYSGQNVGEWVVEEGYRLVHPGTTDWTVEKIPVAVTCRKCNGSRYQVVSVKCPACQGRKELVVGGGGNGHHGRTARGRGPGVISLPVMKVQCYQCRGAGSVQQQRQCPRCRGTGTEIRR